MRGVPVKRLARARALCSIFFIRQRARFAKQSRLVRLLLLLLFLLIPVALVFVFVSHGPAVPQIPEEGPALFDQDLVSAAREVWKQEHRSPSRPEELWDSVKNDVAICIKTGHEVAAHRLTTLRRVGWWSVGRDVPNILVISDSDDPALGVIGVKNYAVDMLRLNSSDHPHADQQIPKHWWDKTGWRGDKDKNLPALHLLRTVFPGKKWYLLLDDDTYIFLENFARYIMQDGMDDRPVYTGKVFYISRCGGFARDGSWAANRSEPRGMFAHGGSGIIINSRAMELVYPTFAECIREYSSCWAGDMQVGLCMRRAGVPLRKRHQGRTPWERHFIPFWPSKALSDKRYSQRWHSDEEPITFHQIPIGEQSVMSSFERKLAKDGDTVHYYELREHLMANGVRPFHSPRFRKFRWFSTEFFTEEMKRQTGITLG